MLRLDDHDPNAWAWITENFGICSSDHVLSKKLWTRFGSRKGSIDAITPFDFGYDHFISHLHTSKPLGESYKIANDPETYSPIMEFWNFVFDHLSSSDDAVVVCENATATRKIYRNWKWGELPPYLCFGDNEIYHVLTPKNIDTRILNMTMKHAFVKWGVGVCSRCDRIPVSSITDDSFFDEIVRNTRHIFLPAFEGNGYLIWTPHPPSNENGIANDR